MNMADELNEQKAFLTWKESAAVLPADARQGMARAQRLLSTCYLRGRGVPKDEASPFIGCSSPHNKLMPRPSAAWAGFTKTARVLRRTLA